VITRWSASSFQPHAVARILARRSQQGGPRRISFARSGLALERQATNNCAPALFLLVAFIFLAMGKAVVAETSNWRAPSHWSAIPASKFVGHPEVVGAWVAPLVARPEYRQSVNVLRFPSSGSIKLDVTRNLQFLKAQDSNVIVLKRHDNKHCHVDASQVVLLSTRDSTYNVLVEQVYTIVRNTLFIGTYIRGTHEPLTASAQRFVETMCPR
jgi:hypothetical protein